MSSIVFTVVPREEELPPSPSPQKRASDDGDSGYNEPIDDAAAFELLPSVSLRSTSCLSNAQLHILHEQQHLQQQNEDGEHVAARTPAARRDGGGVYPYRSRSNGAVSIDSSYGSGTPEYSPISPSPRLPGDGGGDAGRRVTTAESVSSNGSCNHFDGDRRSHANGDGTNGREEVSLLTPSPAGSEEDVSSEKGESRGGGGRVCG